MPGKTYILHGEDEPSIAEALQSLKALLGSPEEVLSNTTVFEGKTLEPGPLAMACNTIPFMTGHRLVVVYGFFERFEERQPGRGARSAGAKTAAKEDQWTGLPGMVRGMPPTTVLVFVSGKVAARNPMLTAVREAAEVRVFPLLQGQQLEAWVMERVSRLGGKITPGALRLLENFAGNDLRLLDNELRKLCTYAGAKPVDEDMVSRLTDDGREAGIFDLVDSVVARRHGRALTLLRQLQEQGAAGPYVVTMLAREVRMLLIAKSMGGRGSSAELQQALGTSSDYVAKKVQERSRSFSQEQLAALHERLLEADISIKDGSATEDLALEMLVMDAAAILAGESQRRGG